MTLRLCAPALADADELLEFELANRAFFEAHINARAEAYYSEAGVRSAIQAAIDQAQADEGYQFLVRNSANQLVARANLSRVRRKHFHSAEVGYRVAKAWCGRGIASQALGLLLTEAFGPLSLRRVEAAVHQDNSASLQVLTRNGFMSYGRSQRSFELQGRWLDTLHLERHAHA